MPQEYYCCFSFSFTVFVQKGDDIKAQGKGKETKRKKFWCTKCLGNSLIFIISGIVRQETKKQLQKYRGFKSKKELKRIPSEEQIMEN